MFKSPSKNCYTFFYNYICYNYDLVPFKNDDLWRAARDNKPFEVKRLLNAGANPNHVLVSMNIISVSNYCFLVTVWSICSSYCY